jgi:hypothetical protein
VLGRIGNTSWKTSLFPKNDSYIVPLKDTVRRAENIDEGDRVKIWLEIS